MYCKCILSNNVLGGFKNKYKSANSHVHCASRQCYGQGHYKKSFRVQPGFKKKISSIQILLKTIKMSSLHFSWDPFRPPQRLTIMKILRLRKPWVLRFRRSENLSKEGKTVDWEDLSTKGPEEQRNVRPTQGQRPRLIVSGGQRKRRSDYCTSSFQY